MSRHFCTRVLATAIAAGLALEVTPATTAQPEEVIVTARKRDESIMKVPATATVLSR